MKTLSLHVSSFRFALYTLYFAFLVLLSSCSVSKKIDKVAKQDLLNKPELTSAHIGISVYDPSTKKYLYNHDGDKYFIPASNTKISTCYAAMKYLGDSLAGLKYRIINDSTVIIQPAGDPTFLHRDFNLQPVIFFLKKFDSKTTLLFNDANFEEQPWGYGWSWDDYSQDYMAERSALPVYGNIIAFDGNANKWSFFPEEIKGKVIDSGGAENSYLTKVDRTISSNEFTIYFNGTSEKEIDVPFYTNNGETNLQLLQKLVSAKIFRKNDSGKIEKNYSVIHSQRTDSLLKIMMHRSDNFFAEQSLLMVSDEMLGVMNDQKIIDTLLKTDYKAMPQKPSWVDGSGLSRFNLFTPQDFVFVLDKMRNEFSWSRITTIFSTGGTGTLGSAYKNLAGKIYAKTGTLTNNAALSGYIITNKGKTLIFSVLVGNHTSSGTTIRNGISQFLQSLIEKY